MLNLTAEQFDAIVTKPLQFIEWKMQMVRYILIGILILNLYSNFGYTFAQKPPIGHYIKIEKSKPKSFISIKEVRVQDYRLFVETIKRKCGENSEEYKFLIPDTVEFEKLYGFSFFLPEGFYKDVSNRDENNDLLIKHGTFPMIAISYEQAVTFCQYWANMWKPNKYVWEYGLPTQADYEMVLKKAKITKNKALSPLQRKGYKYVWGLTDNVAEYIQDGIIIEGGENTELKFVTVEECENPIGFRLKATIVSKK